MAMICNELRSKEKIKKVTDSVDYPNNAGKVGRVSELNFFNITWTHTQTHTLQLYSERFLSVLHNLK